MRIRTKFLALVLLVAGGFLFVTAMSVRTYQQIAAMRGALDGGVRLIAQARRAHGLMIDLVFGLFSPRLYSSLQGVILTPRGFATEKEWAESVAEFRTEYAAFMANPALLELLNDEELRSSYKVADTLSARAYEEFAVLESDIKLIQKRYNSSEDLYIWLQLSKDESLYSVFDHVRYASFYLGNIFESYLDRFVGLLEQSAVLAESRALVAYGIMSALVMAFSVAGVLTTTRSILANISLIDRAVGRMSEGDFSSRVAPMGHDELGSLAEHINLFAARLKANVDTLTSLLGDVNKAIPEAPDLDRILAIVADALLRDKAAECSAICLLKDGRVTRYAWSGFPPVSDWDLLIRTCTAEGFGVGDGPERRSGAPIGHIRPLLVHDAVLAPGTLAESGIDPSLKSVLALPLSGGRRLQGICVFGRRSRVFTDLEMTQLASFSSYAAQVIDNAIANATLRAREDAEYRALQAQIQPHFMYNVLNGFVALNRMGARPALELSLHAFKDMLRYTIDHGRWSSVREEFAFLERYCHLQKLRFEEKFSYLFELEPDAAELNIPKLIIQPLLENAFVHGIEPSMHPCRARVSGKIDSGVLFLEVEDDGIGCDPTAIRDPGRIGIVNVRERLALLYSSSDLELSSSPGSGFRARIAIPVAELDRAFKREDRLEDSN